MFSGMWPWLVAVYQRTQRTNSFLCSGSLINEKIAITAAHCIKPNSKVVPLRAKEIVVHVGRFDVDNNDGTNFEIRNVSRIVLHPDWLEISDDSRDADMLLLIFDGPVTYGLYVSPVCLWHGRNSLNDIVRQIGTVVSWGLQENRRAVNVPSMVEAVVISETSCLRQDQVYNGLTSSRTFCTYNNGGSGPCNGDSAGGFYMKQGSQWVLRGIVATSMSNPTDDTICTLSKPVVYADVAKFVEWIRFNIDLLS
jgi:transmembrane protease serine 9